jgi:23S rRNA pseudouridine1911/1915/1917 synthase
MHPEHEFTIRAHASDAAQRFDVVVAAHLPACSRSFAATLIQAGKITINGEKKKPGCRVRAGDILRGGLPSFEKPACDPEPMALNILFEDSCLIVVNKPAGMVVHPAPGNYSGTLVHGLLYHCPALGGIGGEMRPGIVHRLDKNTSGAIVVAKNRTVHERLSRQFKARKVKKYYLGLVYGKVASTAGEISLPVGRHPVHRKKMSVFSSRGREAVTLWRVKERFRHATLLNFDLKTGRTHQIRVHCAAIHHPLVGDAVYTAGGKRDNCKKGDAEILKLLESVPRQMLHAHRIELAHPMTEEAICFTAPMPQDMQALIDTLSEMDASMEPFPGMPEIQL